MSDVYKNIAKMSNVLKTTYEQQARSVIKALEKRNMRGYYCPDCTAAVKLADELIPENATVAFGGSVSVNESGVMDMLQERSDIRLIDRSKAKTPEETKQMYRDAFSSDVYFMSTNAITMDGELINIDGNGNRAAALIYGPDKIVMIVGMNKLVSSVEEGPQHRRTGKRRPPAKTDPLRRDRFLPRLFLSGLHVQPHGHYPQMLHT